MEAYSGYIILSLVLMGIGALVSGRLKSKFKEYSQIALGNGLSGKEIAEKMLRDNGIHDVQVLSSQGFLSDHYNPADKTVNLSPDVYAGRSISAAAVAAHECGHAVQHKAAYSMLQLRSALVPVVQISSNISIWVIMAGLGVLGFGLGNPTVFLIGIILFAASTVFSLVTLPVEYDASARALRWMESSGMARGKEHDMAADALKWAARTYVVAAISSIATLLYFIMIFMNRRDE
jgi:Zn-dependent membrane protease YugP